MSPDHTTIGIDRWTARRDGHYAGVAQQVERLPDEGGAVTVRFGERLRRDGALRGFESHPRHQSRKRWRKREKLDACLLSGQRRLVKPRKHEVGDKAKRGGVPMPIPAQRRCNMCSPGQTSRVSIGKTQGGSETTPIGVTQKGNSGGSTEQTATRSLKVCPGRGKRFDLVVITRNETRFRSSTVERLIRTQQTGDRPLPEAPRPVRYRMMCALRITTQRMTMPF